LKNQINLENEIHFVVDYRSCPSGIGTIFFDEEHGSKTSLVTDMDCGPKDMAEAKETFKPEAMPDYVDYIPLNNEYWKVREQCLGAILATHRVAYVVDTELAAEVPDFVADEKQSIFLIQNWLAARGIKGIL
jgi:hypothetical protein